MKKLLAVILCLALTAALCLASCGGNQDEKSEAPSSAPESKAETVSQVEEKSEEPSVDPVQQTLDNPDIFKGDKYSGREFCVLTFGVGDDHVSEFVYNVDVKEENLPETVNAAIKARNDKVMDALGVTVTEEYVKTSQRFGGQSIQRVNQIISGSEDKYSMLSICLYDCGTLATSGSLWDLNKLDNLNPENPWWEQYFNESVTIGGQLYFTIGDIGTNNKGSTPCVFYNTKLIQDLGLEDPINLAVSGAWTIDKAIEYTRACPHEEVGAVEAHKGNFGWAGQNDDMYAMLYGSGARVLSPDADGYPMLTINTPTAIDTVGKVLELMGDSAYVSGNDLFGLYTWPMPELQKAFQENRCLFYSGGIDVAVTLDMEAVFGILPVPKLSEEQDHYYSLINTWTTNAYCIATNLDEEGAEFAAAVMDVMGYYSWSMYPDSLAFNYYEKMLKSQKLAREDSEAMLDRIFEARGCELGAIFQIGKTTGSTSVNEMLIKLIEGKGNTEFVSLYGMYENAFEADVEALNEYFNANLD